MGQWNKIDELIRHWIKEAREKIILSFETVLDIQTKANVNDLVTNMDKDVEQFFIHNIRSEFPEHRIMAEEGFGDKFKDLDGVVWIIDPIDGTMNFVHQQRNFFISIGVYHNGVGKLGYLYDVVHDELYYAKAGEGAYCNGKKLSRLKEVLIENALVGFNASWVVSNNYMDHHQFIPLVKDVRGTRSYGSAALEIAYVATGRLDSYINMRLAPWDIAAGKIIIEELGGIVTNLQGEQVNLLETGSILIAGPELHAEIFRKYLKKQ
ncbi:inositol monophosphatase family protein [Bacillus sp. FSL K6-3431]|uniref:inositol monophosphatase family protein n=1 Tax=Bacillus sp. FSL K6-3431 TaxID=2921500 RepID=UPI0030F79A3A